MVALGGAKVSDKLAVLEALAPHADALLIGGAMAYTFLAARGEPVGASRVERDQIEEARKVEQRAAQAGRRILLPTDHVIAQKLEAGTPSRVVREIPDGWMGLDIGPETAKRYAAEIAGARTFFWNGPMGVFEIPDCGGHARGGARCRREPRRHRGGRWRLAGRSEPARPRRAHDPSLDRRRRFARVRAGPRAAGRGGAGALMRTPILAANWKMHKTVSEALRFTTAFLPLVKDATAVEIVLAPPFTALARVGEALAGSNVALAAQNVNPEPQGAFTGEISAPMLLELGSASDRVPAIAQPLRLGRRADRAGAGADLARHPRDRAWATLEQRESAAP